MNDSSCPILSSQAHRLSVLLGLGSLWFASACSADYPLGKAKRLGSAPTTDAAAARSTGAGVAPAGLLGAPDITLSAENGSMDFISPVGDLDGDGFDDLVTAGTNEAEQIGFMHVRYGGPRPADADAALAFDESGARLVLPSFGYPSVAKGVGDVDGDGYDDVLIQSPANALFLIYGGPRRLEGTLAIESVAIRFVPPGAGAFGSGAWNVALGDIDGDGFDDFALILSAGLGLPNPADGIYVFYGGSQRFSGEVPFTAAAAVLRSSETVYPFPVGDVDGDGLADTIVRTLDAEQVQHAPFFVPGQPQRFSGAIELESSATRLVGSVVPTNDSYMLPGMGDLDGDGLHDVMLRDANDVDHIFYGAPGLFANGLDFSAAAATVDSQFTGHLIPAGDLDGDGYDDLLLMFARVINDSPYPFDYALLAGSRDRFAGAITLPTQDLVAPSPATRFGLVNSALLLVTTVGDLDGDGAADLLSVFDSYDSIGLFGGPLPSTVDFHIHYGKPMPQPAPVH